MSSSSTCDKGMFYTNADCNDYYGDYHSSTRSHAYVYDSRAEAQPAYLSGDHSDRNKLFYHHSDRTDMPVCIDVNMSMYIPYSAPKQNSSYFGTPLPVVPTTYESYSTESAYHSVDKSYQPQAAKHWAHHQSPTEKIASWTPAAPQLQLPVKLPVQSQVITSNTDKKAGGKHAGGKRMKVDHRANPNAPKFRCEVCQKQYCRRSTLKAHVRQHSGERPYACTMCDKKFSQAANLTAHTRVHTGEKPFSCPVCCRPFSQSSSLVTHKRTHTGERPYKCEECSKAFTDSSTLTKHMRTHTGIKPYNCQVCMLRFSQSGNLNRHMKTHWASM